MSEKVLNALPTANGISIQDLAAQIDLPYHTTRRLIMKLLEEGRATIFGKNGKTFLYSANIYSLKSTLPKVRGPRTGAPVPLLAYSEILALYGKQHEQQEVKTLKTMPFLIHAMNHAIVEANLKEELPSPEFLTNVRLQLIKIIEDCEATAGLIRGIINHETLWQPGEYYRYKEDTQWREFVAAVMEAENIRQGKEIYSPEIIAQYREETIETLL